MNLPTIPSCRGATPQEASVHIHPAPHPRATRTLRGWAWLAASGLLALSPPAAHAQFTWDGNSVLNATQTYDGAAVDAAKNPYSFGSTGSASGYIGQGGTGVLNVVSGTLNWTNGNPNVGRDLNGNGAINISNATLNVIDDGMWGTSIGHGGGTGVVTVGAGGVLTWLMSGDNEQRVMVGNGKSGATPGTGTINVQGGSVTISLDPSENLDDNDRGLYFGRDSGVGTLNLLSGSFTFTASLPLVVGGTYKNDTATLTNTATGVIRIGNGTLVMSASGQLLFGGTDDYISFTTGGTGSVSVNGWSETAFQTLVDNGNIRIDDLALTPGDYSRFTYSQNGDQGVYQLNSSSAAPVVGVPTPSSATLSVGQSASFTVLASGDPTPAVQWQKSTDEGTTWTDIDGATSTTYGIASVLAADSGLYRLVATNTGGTATSSAATLAVTYPAPTITTPPSSVTVFAGADVTFSVSATGLGTLTYQWLKDGIALDGQTGGTLIVSSVSASDAGTYSVIVTDSAASAEGLTPTTATASAALGLLNVTVPDHAVSWNMVGAGSVGNPWGGSSELGTLSSGESAGVLPLPNWNNSSATNGVNIQTTPQALIDNTGAATPTTVAWDSANTWAVGGTVSTKTADQRLIHGYIERRLTTSPGYITVTFANVTYGTYDVYVYTAGGSTNSVGAVTATTSAGSTSLYYKTFGNPGTPPGFVEGTATDATTAAALGDSNFVHFAGLAGATLTITCADAVTNTNAGGIAAISIVDTTPSDVAYPPLVTTAPTSKLVLGGSATSLTVAATASNAGGTLSYQWQRDGADIAGATSATLNIASPTGADTGAYTVIVTETSSRGVSTASSGASLVVVDSTRPALLSVDFNTSSTATMTGDAILLTTGPLTSGITDDVIGQGTTQWNGLVGSGSATTYTALKDSAGLPLTGVTVSVSGAAGIEDNVAYGALSGNSTSLLRDYLYTDSTTVPITCSVGGLGAFAGRKVTLVVYAIGKQSNNFYNESGTGLNDAATVTLGASNNYTNAAPFVTANDEGRDLAYNNTTAADGAAYATFEGIVSPSGVVSFTVGVDSDGPRVPLDGFQLLLTDGVAGVAPTVTAQPAGGTRLAGVPFTFSAGVTASPSAALQWQKSTDGGTTWTDVAGATAESYAIAAVAASDAGSYRVMGSNTAGTVTSDAAVLVVQSYSPDDTTRAISVNWSNTSGGVSTATLGANEYAGVVDVPHWNNLYSTSANFSALADSTGEATGAAIHLSSTGSWYTIATQGTLPMQKVLQGYWDIAPGASTVGTTATMTVSGITYTSYDVYVYFATDGTTGTPIAEVSVNGGAPIYGAAWGRTGLPSGITVPPAYLAEATATDSAGVVLSTHVRATGMTGDTCTITAIKVNNNWGIAGIQIVNTGTVAPAAPTGLGITTGDATADLTWSSVAEATSYNIYRGTATGTYTRIATGVTTTSFTDTGLANGTTYFYAVKAVNAGGASTAYSSEVNGTPGSSATALQTWRQTYFATTDNSGTAANAADPDADGLANLAEYALGLDPTVSDAAGAVTLSEDSGVLTLTFAHIGDATLTYTVEATSDLTGTWSPVATYTGLTSAGTTTYTDTVILTSGTRRFLRLVITSSE